jgi:hypothetical protein
MAFEEDGMDWMTLVLVWGTGLKEVVVWHYDVDTAADKNLTEE